MYPEGSSGYTTALESYSLIEEMILFTKTEWTREQIKTFVGRDCEVIGASIDIDLYRPRPHNLPKWPYGPIRVAAMIRPRISLSRAAQNNATTQNKLPQI